MQQLLMVWQGLSFNRKVISIVATMAMFFAILAMTRIVSAPSMSLLYGGLDPSSAGEVVRALEQRGVTYDVRGGSIFVDSKQRDELRLTLASEGLPANSASGYELLDNLSGFGTTSQMFDAAYWRAKEGELARTIVANSFVNSARVHIANSTANPFQRSVKPTASVSVVPVGDISSSQAKALKFLVASAVAGLAAEDVAIIGADGSILGATDETTQSTLGEERSSRIREKVERLLEARVGPGNAIVEVSVETVLEREEIRERTFDPEGRVAISTDSEETSTTSSQAGGSQVTVASNLPDGDAAGGEESNSQNNQTRERINYEVSETEREIVRVPGAIKRLTVAVLVNGQPSVQDDGTTLLSARSEEELASLRDLVESAVGFDAERGDIITIKSMELQPVEPMGTSVERSFIDFSKFDVMSAIQMAVLAIVTLILGLFVVRPIVSGRDLSPAAETSLTGTETGLPALDGAAPSIASAGDAGGETGALPELSLDNDIGALPELPMMGGMMADEDPASRLRNMIEERQSETVEILREWLEEKEETA